MAKKTYLIGFLMVVVMASYVYVQLGTEVKIQVNAGSTALYYNESGKWILGATEYNYLYNKSKSVSRISSNIQTIVGNTTIITRNSSYGKPYIKDTYTFDALNNELENFPINHRIEIFGAKGLEYRYVVKLNYSGTAKTLTGNKFSLGKVTVIWDTGYSSATLSSTGTLTVKYPIASDYFLLNNRLFDPVTTSLNTAFTIDQLLTNRSFEHGYNVTIFINVTDSGVTVPVTVCLDTNQPYEGINYTCSTGILNITYLMVSENSTLGLMNFSSTYGFVYQESANVTNQGGNDGEELIYNGSYLTSGSWDGTPNIYDGNFDTFGFATGGYGVNSFIYINYTKPPAAEPTSLWKVKSSPDFGQTSYLNIDSLCWSFSDTFLSFRIVAQPVAIGVGTITWDCWNSTEWKNIGSCVGGSCTSWIYEEAMLWNKSSLATSFNRTINLTFHTFDEINYAHLMLNGLNKALNVTVYINNTRLFTTKNLTGMYLTGNDFYNNRTTTNNETYYMTFSFGNTSNTFYINAVNQTVKNATFNMNFNPSGEQWSEYINDYNTYYTQQYRSATGGEPLGTYGPYAGGVINESQAMDDDITTYACMLNPSSIYWSVVTKETSTPSLLVKNMTFNIWYTGSTGASLQIYNYSSGNWSGYSLTTTTPSTRVNENISIEGNSDVVRELIKYRVVFGSAATGDCSQARYYESFVSFNYSSNQTGLVRVDIGSDGVVDFSYENMSTNIYYNNLTAFQNHVTKRCSSICNVPVSIISGTLFTMNITNINLTQDSTIFVNGSYFNDILANNTGYVNIPVTIEAVNKSLINFTYNVSYKGNDNITFFAHFDGTTEDSNIINITPAGSTYSYINYPITGNVTQTFTENMLFIDIITTNISIPAAGSELGFQLRTSNKVLLKEVNLSFGNPTSGLANITANISMKYSVIPNTQYRLQIVNYTEQTTTAVTARWNLNDANSYANGEALLNDAAIANSDYQMTLNGTYQKYNPSNATMYAEVYYSPYNLTLPKNIEYIEFIPNTPYSKNVSAFGQSPLNPILNFTTHNVIKNMNLSIGLNETYSCVNILANSLYDPSNAIVLNTSYISLTSWTNLAKESNVSLYLWANYNCSGTSWQLWNPVLQFRGCAVGSICQ